MSVLHESGSFDSELYRKSTVEIFNTYLQCHLAPPDGIRGINGKKKYTHPGRGIK